MMNAAWRPPGFCVPNNDVYPHQWLWDSCFHALVWAEVDPARAQVELTTSLAKQHRLGFVPHMTYWTDPAAGSEFWQRDETSSITQPPMFGHTVAELRRRGVTIDGAGLEFDELVNRVVLGLTHLLADRQRSPAGLVCVFHPWESGCDDSPRWPGADMAADKWRDGGVQEWRRRKGEMVTGLQLDDGVPVDSSVFVVGSVGFSALVAWNALEVVRAVPDQPGINRLAVLANGLINSIAQRWSQNDGTWIDDPVVVAEVDDDQVTAAARVRTSDAMLALLVDPRAEAFAQLTDQAAFGAVFGPTGVHLAEPSFDPAAYWRGPAWPQMSYLLWVAATRAGQPQVAEALRSALAGGAIVSGLAEYWNADTGQGHGAAPQTWAGLGLIAERGRSR